MKSCYFSGPSRVNVQTETINACSSMPVTHQRKTLSRFWGKWELRSMGRISKFLFFFVSVMDNWFEFLSGISYMLNSGTLFEEIDHEFLLVQLSCLSCPKVQVLRLITVVVRDLFDRQVWRTVADNVQNRAGQLSLQPWRTLCLWTLDFPY